MSDREDTTTIRVSRSIYEDFKQSVRDRSGKHFQIGLYMKAANKALLRDIATNSGSNANTQTQNAKLNTPIKILKLRDKVIAYLESEHNYDGIGCEPVRVMLKHLRQGITYARSCKNEDRTIVPWIKEFIRYEIISEVDTGIFEFTFGGKKSENNLKQKQIQKEIDSAFK